ncbi:eco57IR [Symbiodinium pilosum]|uniref:site-specific DNA-methyltransferase (adenine-specific) n=1 Tax=Symbiodinium pilosum TaxID=2952 RepID=A0A812NKG7_SYMPI|nr:eco57IR [Symbiodinium pilosum]
MQTEHIKRYAPAARTEFIAAMSKQAAKYGISEKEVLPIEIRGDVVLVGDRPFPASIVRSRDALVQKVGQLGFHQAMEQAAYCWFNRLCAIRYMELADYLGHGRRVLSHPDQDNGFQILEDCLDIDLPGLDQQKVRELKLDGTKDEELYRELLLGQCHALHQAMPFLFEPVDDATELLLPENLTKTASLIKELVTAIPEDNWANIEIIGWLYQFYISEKKDQVIGKVVKSEDIPAATQLFTPNWIVKYMVQNSLGAQWLATYPQSPLKGQMDYYIEPAEQTDEVNTQLAAITPSQLNPEELTLIDPASGSGHILVEAYEVFKAIYLERGYRQRDVAQLILEKNLFGLDIDERAAQLTGFALMMKGRADERRLFERGVKLNVMALVDSAGFDAEALAKGVELSDYNLRPGDLTELKRLFEHATPFGSLIQVPDGLAEKLPALKQLSEASSQDLFVSEALKRLGPLVQQAELLAAQYDAVVANPPYMGSGGMNALLKKFVKDYFPDAKSDMFACFIERGYTFAKEAGYDAMVTMQSWMFLSSFQKMRERLLREKSINTMAHLGARAFGSISGEVVQTTVFSLRNRHPHRFKPAFFRLLDGGEEVKRLALTRGECRYDSFTQGDFKKIPGSNKSLGEVVEAKQGIATADNGRFLRSWSEVSQSNIGMGISSHAEAEDSRRRWFPYNKGGGFRKWYGNQEHVVNWEGNGRELRAFSGSVVRNPDYQFRASISWSDVTSSTNAFRLYPTGFLFDSTGHSAFPGNSATAERLLCLCNNHFTQLAARILNPTMHFHVGYFNDLPAGFHSLEVAQEIAEPLIQGHRNDWNAYEHSWDFQSLPILTASTEPTPTLESSYTAWITQNKDTIAEMKCLEEENNRLFIDAYGLQDELTPDVPIEQITLTVNPAYRYGGKLTEEEQWTRFRQDTMEELVSYAIGCMMGRYSLDAPGLIYAHSGNEGFDPSCYPTFPADDDGIVPLTDTDWFEDDAAHRVEKFVSVAWNKSHLEENLQFLADNLSPKRGESSRDTIRRYLCDKFYKDHMQTYKKRPIYWLFSSGKQKAFQCLVYLHRYNEGTLARMRTEYVIPLTAKLASHVEKLEKDKDASGTTAEIKRLEKQIDKLHKQQAELSAFDEKLRHHADQRISLDLDDGVKVNYGKFGDLLSDVKAITGKNPASLAF